MFRSILEFAIGSRTLIVEEPQDGEMPTTVTMTVQRLGGTLGVVTVSWRIISSNGVLFLIAISCF